MKVQELKEIIISIQNKPHEPSNRKTPLLDCSDIFPPKTEAKTTVAQEAKSRLKQRTRKEYNDKYNKKSGPLVDKPKPEQPTDPVKILSRQPSSEPLESHPSVNTEEKTLPPISIRNQKPIKSTRKPTVTYDWWINETNLTFCIYPIIHPKSMTP